MDGTEINPLWGIVWMVIGGTVFYLLCSLVSWDFHISEWNLFSRILGFVGFF